MKTTGNSFSRFIRSTGLALMTILTGCEVGSKKHFISDSAKSIYLMPPSGVLWIVPGMEVYSNGQVGLKSNLIYFLVLCPGLVVNGKGGVATYDESINTYTSKWITDSGVVEVSVSWDKTTDSIIIGKEHYSRGNGNTFLLLRDPKGVVSVAQVKCPEKDLMPVQIVDLLRQKVENDRAKSALQLFSIE